MFKRPGLFAVMFSFLGFWLSSPIQAAPPSAAIIRLNLRAEHQDVALTMLFEYLRPNEHVTEVEMQERNSLVVAILAKAQASPAFAIKFLKKICEYSRADSPDLKTKQEVLKSFHIQTKLMELASVAIMSAFRFWTPWKDEAPLSIEFSGTGWLSLLGQIPSAEIVELVLSQRIFEMRWLADTKRYMSVHPLLKPGNGGVELMSYLVDFVAFQSEHEIRPEPFEFSDLLGFLGSMEKGLNLENDQLSVPIISEKRDFLRYDADTRAILGGFPRIPVIYAFGVFAPNHPQAEREFLKLANIEGKEESSSRLRHLGLLALAATTSESPAVRRALLRAVDGGTLNDQKAALSRLASFSDFDEELQLLFWRLWRNNKELASVVVNRLNKITAPVEALATVVLQQFLEAPSYDHVSGPLLIRMAPLAHGIVDSLTNDLSRASFAQQWARLHILVETNQLPVALRTALLNVAINAPAHLSHFAIMDLKKCDYTAEEIFAFISTQFSSPDPDVHHNALLRARSIYQGAEGFTRIQSWYIEALQSSDPEVRMAALKGLRPIDHGIGDELYQVLLKLTSADTVEERTAVIVVLASARSTDDRFMRQYLSWLEGAGVARAMAGEGLSNLGEVSEEYLVRILAQLDPKTEVEIAVCICTFLGRRQQVGMQGMKAIVAALVRNFSDGYLKGQIEQVMERFSKDGSVTLAVALASLLDDPQLSGTAHLHLMKYYSKMPPEVEPYLLKAAMGPGRKRARMALSTLSSSNVEIQSVFVDALEEADEVSISYAITYLASHEISDRGLLLRLRDVLPRLYGYVNEFTLKRIKQLQVSVDCQVELTSPVSKPE